MKHAIQCSGNGPIILEGRPLEELKEHIRRNPTRSLVKKSKGQWVIVPDSVSFGCA